MPEMYEVLRVIAGIDGKPIFSGEIIDASEWRNKKALINAGRLRRLDDDEVAPVAPVSPKPKAAPKPKATPKSKVVEETIEAPEEEVTEDVNQ